MTAEFSSAHTRMTLLWFSVLAAPMLIGIALVIMVTAGNYTAPAVFLPEQQLRMGAIGAMALMLVCACPLRNLLLSPAAIASRPLQGNLSNDNETSHAIAKTQASMFLLLGILDAVAMVVVALSLMQADFQLALLNGVYSLVLGIIAKPDFSGLLKQVKQQLVKGE